MLVRRVQSHGPFRWKQRHDVFLSEVLWGERVGLLPIDERWYTVPLARFDSWQRRILPLPPEKNPKGEKVGERAGFYIAAAGEEEVSLPLHPIPSPGYKEREKCQRCARSKMSGISPAVQVVNIKPVRPTFARQCQQQRQPATTTAANRSVRSIRDLASEVGSAVPY